MADNTSISTSPGGTASGLPGTPNPFGGSLRHVRTGFAGVVLAVALFLGGVAIYYASNAQTLADPEKPAATWGAGFKTPQIWPIFAWAAAFSLAGLAGSFVLAGRNRPEMDRPAWLSRVLGLFLLVGGGCAVLIPVYLLITRSFQTAISPVFVWAVTVFGVLLLVGMMLLGEGERNDEGRLRRLLMGAGLSVGLLTFVLGLTLGFFTFWEDVSKGMDTWRKHPAVLVWPAVAYLAGLGLVFVSIQPAMPLIRQEQNTRRVVFGANLLVTVLLLLGVLALPNILAYANPMEQFFGRPFDWTKGNLNALSPPTRDYLANLREPIKAYAIVVPNSLVGEELKTLLQNCGSLNSNFTYQMVYLRQSDPLVQELVKEYGITEPGLLLVVGNDKNNYTFVSAGDLSERSRGPGPQSQTFKGERAMMNALAALVEGEMVIYFTQGHGEYPFEQAPQDPQKMLGQSGGSLATLRRQLGTRQNVKTQPLTLNRDTKEVPKNATVVVIARPRSPFSPEEVEVLRKYMQRQVKMKTEKSKDKNKRDREVEEVTTGKLMILLEPVVLEKGGQADLASTGLERLLLEYNVKVGNNRILAAARPPTLVEANAPADSPNPIARAFSPGEDRTVIFYFSNARTVEPASEQGGNRKRADPIMASSAEWPAWTDTNFGLSPHDVLSKLLQNREKFNAVLAKKPLGIAVAVADSANPPGMPHDAAHASAAREKDTPRLVVFGTASWVTDESLRGNRGERLELFSACTSWLRQRRGNETLIRGIPDKTREPYKLNIPKERDRQLVFLPLALMVLGVIVVGTGVWVVRRR